MKKNMFRIALVSALAIGCAATALSAGCAKEYETKSYYNKTVTFTGNDFHRGFEQKGAYDNYGNGSLGETTYKKIAETYWGDIDWAESKPTALFTAPPASVDAFKTIAENYHPYETWDGLSFTVTKEDSVTVTLNLPTNFSGFGWGTSVTMTLYEDKNKLQSDYSDINPSELEAGYHGMGVKADGDKRLVLDVRMAQSTGKDFAIFELRSEKKDGYGYYETLKKVSTMTDGSIDLISKTVDNGDGSGSTKNVLNISYYAEITIVDKK